MKSGSEPDQNCHVACPMNKFWEISWKFHNKTRIFTETSSKFPRTFLRKISSQFIKQFSTEKKNGKKYYLLRDIFNILGTLYWSQVTYFINFCFFSAIKAEIPCVQIHKNIAKVAFNTYFACSCCWPFPKDLNWNYGKTLSDEFKRPKIIQLWRMKLERSWVDFYVWDNLFLLSDFFHTFIFDQLIP